MLEKINIDDSWSNYLNPEFEKEYFVNLKKFLAIEEKNQIILPPKNKIFSAFKKSSFEKIKVVVIGQDPYHGEGQANGLSFSVEKGIKVPPSLRNIFKELDQDLKLGIPNHGDLNKWSSQGVFLLNATLTVQKSNAGSHQKKGWETFTDKVIETISENKKDVVFLLWGRFAQNKSNLIDESKHLILNAAHPSPFSAHNGFFGCNHFSKTNKFLVEKNIEPIDWVIN